MGEQGEEGANRNKNSLTFQKLWNTFTHSCTISERKEFPNFRIFCNIQEEMSPFNGLGIEVRGCRAFRLENKKKKNLLHKNKSTDRKYESKSLTHGHIPTKQHGMAKY